MLAQNSMLTNFILAFPLLELFKYLIDLIYLTFNELNSLYGVKKSQEEKLD